MKKEYIKIINDQHERLQSLYLHKKLPMSIAAYIKEFLLTKEFLAMVEDLNKNSDDTQTD